VPITTKLWVRTRSWRGVLVQHYVIKFVSDLRQVDGFLRVLRFPPPIKLTATILWNVVESDVKHHKPTPNNLLIAKHLKKKTIPCFFFFLVWHNSISCLVSTFTFTYRLWYINYSRTEIYNHHILHDVCHMWNRNCLHFRSTGVVHPRLFVWFVLLDL